MLLTIADVLGSQAVSEIRTTLDCLAWRDGSATAGTRARQTKRNQQADLTSGKGAKLHESLMATISGHPLVKAAARPKRFSRLLISRTVTDGGYGFHTDNAIMGSGTSRMRSDLSFTLFLSAPEDYDGGELTIDLPGAVQTLKPAAGDLVLYPSTSIHQVAPVTKGVRLACVGWIESMVRDAAQRELLLDLDNLRTELRRQLPAQSAELLTLDKSISNLLRMWAET